MYRRVKHGFETIFSIEWQFDRINQKNGYEKLTKKDWYWSEVKCQSKVESWIKMIKWLNVRQYDEFLLSFKFVIICTSLYNRPGVPTKR